MPFSFAVDEAWAKKNNELLRDTRRLRLSAFLLGAVLLAAGLGIANFVGGVGGVIVAGVFAVLAIVFVIIGIIAPSKVGGAQQLYDAYPLAPAIIAEVNPRDIVLMALVNTNADPHKPPRWGLALRTVTSIKGHDRKYGTRVPAVAVSGRRTTRNQDHWDEITPMPIAWGTPDPDAITAARKAIPHQEWDILEKNLKNLDKVKATRFNLLVL
ncbi:MULTISPECIES: DUF3239 domain-containing protein [unclassified Corynebacterium]|uniref:DUF3239 domain-containing protein n=1 Tax=unclassified Corynebacterium TaxID=2624378 RepID=UPI0029C9B447|nr:MULTISPECIES: DUF3239 domain-containing protein [unclassified Corynebacterium]WPF66728.1 DUF3239 domain-containing protein [Corynebacterium sp. 22KM0430]WPF69216.1 DUF3239 domain-containing protein [Corynebacterium sp. 21KM1197]